MKTIRKLAVSLSMLVLFSSATPIHTRIIVYMIGDSTMANKAPEKHPETGWGQVFGDFFDKRVTVDNRAMDGRSTRSFIAEGRWNAILERLREDDYVIIQFGHNDEKVDSFRGTTIYDYKENLKKFIAETRAKKATPILLTPVTRRTFADGKLTDSHGAYSNAVREVAAEEKVAFIDAHRISERLIVELGPEMSKRLYLWVDPGVYAHYPEGKKDNTHFTPEGAHIIAAAMAKEIAKLNLPLGKLLK